MWSVQSNFSRGELTPELTGKSDIDIYYKGLSTATNVLLVPHGGLKTRPGTQYISTELDGRLESFTNSRGSTYLFLFTAGKLWVFNGGSKVGSMTVNGVPAQTYITISHTFDQIEKMDVVTSGDSMFLFHSAVATHQITWNSTTDWTTITNGSMFSDVPQYNFNDSSSPAGTAEVQVMTFSGTITENDRLKLLLNGILTEEIALSDITTAAGRASNERNFSEALKDHPSCKGTTFTVSQGSGGGYPITITFDSASDYPFSLLTATWIYQTSPSTGRLSTTRTTTGVSKKEAVWSATRGWPRCATFHEGRLFVASTTTLPKTVWGSNVNDPLNFRVGKALDDNAVTFTLSSDKANVIGSIISNRSLQIFTSNNEFYVPVSPITPGNVAAKIQTSVGSKRLRPITLDGATIFVQKQGRGINSFIYSSDTEANQTVSLSMLSQHMISGIRQLEVSTGTSLIDASYMYIVNDTGEITVLNSLAAEGIQSFTRYATDGQYRSVCCIDSDVYYLVKRVVGGVDKYFLEIENGEYALDCGNRVAAVSTTLSGLTHLNGETVQVRALTAEDVADGIAGGSQVADEVVSGGVITLDNTYSVIEAGLDYSCIVKTMPLNVAGLNRSISKKRIKRADLNLYQTTGVKVNGYDIPLKAMGVNQFSATSPFTGIKRVSLGGYSYEAYATIERSGLGSFHVLAIGLEIKV